MTARRVLVTGGAGFIGSQVADACIASGHDVVVADDLSSGSRENVPAAARLIEGDFAADEVLSLVRQGAFDVVNHHAAQIDVRKSVADPAFDADVNVVRTLRLIQSAVEGGVKKVVFASSGGAMYGEPEQVPQDEAHPVRPLSPYGCAKLAVEHYLEYFSQVYGLRSVRLRYGNVYGPRQNRHGEAGVIAIFAGRLLAGQKLTVYGTGEQTRDFVFVDDVVQANLAALDDVVEGAFNVGTGVETSINAVARVMLELSGLELPIEHAEAKKGEQRRSVIDGARLRRVADLDEPVRLREGLTRTWKWFASRGR